MNTQRILYIPQFSMNSNGIFYIDKDGNFIVLKTILKHLKNYNPDPLIIDILLPNEQIEETKFFSDINAIIKGTTLKINYIRFPFRVSPIENRYHFDFNAWNDVISKDQTPIAIFNNIPEISRNIRALLGSKKTFLVSLHHFTDYPKENALVSNWENGNLFSYYWRQIDGMLSSDENIFNCESSTIEWIENMKYVFKESYLPQLEKDLKYIYYTDLDEYVSTSDSKFDEFTSIFASRITGSLYTNWQKVFELFQNDNIKGRVFICNPSYEKGIDVLKNDGYLEGYTDYELKLDELTVKTLKSPNGKILVVNENMDRDKYIKVCSKAHVGINLYTSEMFGGLAQREVTKAGNLLPFIPNIYEYKKWLKNVDINLTFTTMNEVTVEKFNKFVELYDTKEHKQILMDFYNSEQYTNYSNTINKVFNSIFK